MNYLSHPDKLLSSHIQNIAAFDAEDALFCIVARFHDLGKVTDSFQDYIRKIKKSANPHAFISGVLFLLHHKDSLNVKNATFGINAIISHHGHLKSYKDIINELVGGKMLPLAKAQKEEIYAKAAAVAYFGLQNIDFEEVEDFALDNDSLVFSISDYLRQKELFSKLIYADKYEAIFSEMPQKNSKVYPVENINAYKMEFSKNDFRDNARSIVFENFAANKNANIYLLTAPTGIGKTLLSLELASAIKELQNRERIIYTIPFTSIIDQSAAIFEKIFPNAITKHHHKSEYKTEDEEGQNRDYDRAKFLTESWSEPFIVSTFYQLFFALFSNENSENIKFHSLKNSVVVMDEVQAIPHQLWSLMPQMFEKLAETLNMTFVLMSATMPLVAKGYELSDKKRFFGRQNRYRLEFLGLGESGEEAKLLELKEAILKEYGSGKSVLCVVNTIKNSKRLFGLLKKEFKENLFCLNSYMLPIDREATITNLKESDSNQVKHKILISTQVVEAGVDLDFDVGFRELAPLSSIFQTAGRINREGLKGQTQVFVFDTLGFGIYDKSLMQATKNHLLEKLKKLALEEKNILEIIEGYFETAKGMLGDSKNIEESIKKFDFNVIDTAIKEIFKTEDSTTESVCLGIDLRLFENEYFDAKDEFDKWAQKKFKEQKFKELAPCIVNIKTKDLNISGIKHSDIFGIKYVEYLDGIYSSKSGFLIESEKDIENVFN
ncbi:CRISPR-associated helicase Cas3' [Wolinella succinogenes]|uniref:CRISPR-associated helicase Cas3' n=1 Tax=Wolinella succinogenes TaxID=844 RepID=UPI002FC8E480